MKNKLLKLIASSLLFTSLVSCTNTPSTSSSSSSSSSPTSNPSTSDNTNSSSTSEENNIYLGNITSKEKDVLGRMFENKTISVDSKFVPIASVKKVFNVVDNTESKQTTAVYLVEGSDVVGRGKELDITIFSNVENGIIKKIDYLKLNTDNYSKEQQLKEEIQKYINTDASIVNNVGGATVSSNLIQKLLRDSVLCNKGELENTYSLKITAPNEALKVNYETELTVEYKINDIIQSTLPELALPSDEYVSFQVRNNKLIATGLKETGKKDYTFSLKENNAVKTIISLTVEKEAVTNVYTLKITAPKSTIEVEETIQLTVEWTLNGETQTGIPTLNLPTSEFVEFSQSGDKLTAKGLKKTQETSFEISLTADETIKSTISLTVTEPEPVSYTLEASETEVNLTTDGDETKSIELTLKKNGEVVEHNDFLATGYDNKICKVEFTNNIAKITRLAVGSTNVTIKATGLDGDLPEVLIAVKVTEPELPPQEGGRVEFKDGNNTADLTETNSVRLYAKVYNIENVDYSTYINEVSIIGSPIDDLSITMSTETNDEYCVISIIYQGSQTFNQDIELNFVFLRRGHCNWNYPRCKKLDTSFYRIN